MQTKNSTSLKIEKALRFLNSHARNMSKSKEANEDTNKTPKEDGLNYSDVSELDICYSVKYDSYFIKVFYFKTKKSYRFSFDESSKYKWFDLWDEWITEKKKESNPFYESEESPW